MTAPGAPASRASSRRKLTQRINQALSGDQLDRVPSDIVELLRAARHELEPRTPEPRREGSRPRSR